MYSQGQLVNCCRSKARGLPRLGQSLPTAIDQSVGDVSRSYDVNTPYRLPRLPPGSDPSRAASVSSFSQREFLAPTPDPSIYTQWVTWNMGANLLSPLLSLSLSLSLTLSLPLSPSPYLPPSLSPMTVLSGDWNHVNVLVSGGCREHEASSCT